MYIAPRSRLACVVCGGAAPARASRERHTHDRALTTHVGLSRPLIPRLTALLSARTFPYIACAEAVHEEGV
eukprot:scaffold14205_cov43-Phaeocystis_antarctica.AAC.1